MLNLHIIKRGVRLPDPESKTSRRQSNVSKQPKKEFSKGNVMKNLICLAAAGFLLVSTLGCANGPIRNWFRGSACNTCQPAAQPSFGPGPLGACTDGCPNPSTLGNPIFQQPTGQASIQGDVITNPSDPYFNSNSTTQNLGYQPSQPALGTGAAGNFLSPPGSGSRTNGF